MYPSTNEYSALTEQPEKGTMPPIVKKEAQKTANQLYKEEMSKKRFAKGGMPTFKQWLTKAKESGLLKNVIDRAYDTVNVKKPQQEAPDEDKKIPEKTKILGMQPILFYASASTVALLTLWGIVSLFKTVSVKGKK